MNQNNLRNFQFGMTDITRLLFPFLIIWLISSIGLWWLVKSLLILFGLLLILPIVGFIGFRWWLKRNLIESKCPVCSHEFVSLKSSEFRCPSCSEPLTAEDGHFVRLVPAGTIDVSAVEVSAQPVDD